uniref:Uncharacterized protein n=1 Tax=Glossina pallidipes TaxID=7398 RepID=A0A1A9ZAU3_GLOPL
MLIGLIAVSNQCHVEYFIPFKALLSLLCRDVQESAEKRAKTIEVGVTSWRNLDENFEIWWNS